MRAAGLAAVAAIAGCAYDRPAFEPTDAVVDDDADPLDADAAIDAGNACAVDGDCASQLCVDGACIPASAIRYVAIDGGEDGDCTQQRPCQTIAQARAAAPPSGPVYVVVGSGTYPAQVRIEGETVTIVGAGPIAPIITASNGPAIEVVSAIVTLRHLQVRSTTALAADGLRCRSSLVIADRLIARGSGGDGIDGRDCELTLRRSTLTNNTGAGLQLEDGIVAVSSTSFHANGFGGAVIVTPRSCAIVGSLFHGNGGIFAQTSGARLSCDETLRVDNVTFANNTAPDGNVTGLTCVGTSVTRQVRNVLFAGASPQLSGCTATYSLFAGVPLPPQGMGNRAAASGGFVNERVGDFHLAPGSAAHGGGDPATAASRDLDDEPRPQAAWDIGADEIL